MGLDDPPRWAELGFSSEADWREWETWRRDPKADPSAWVEFVGEGWYRSRDLIHVKQLAALAGAPVQLNEPQPVAESSGDDGDLDEVLADVGWVRK
ncbi:MAG TPA: hypothetical protein VG937_30190 [Polyangiaceae bacterium]|nr:hypothetical protein [Polyangiaceae bacterium]